MLHIGVEFKVEGKLLERGAGSFASFFPRREGVPGTLNFANLEPWRGAGGHHGGPPVLQKSAIEI